VVSVFSLIAMKMDMSVFEPEWELLRPPTREWVRGEGRGAKRRAARRALKVEAWRLAHEEVQRAMEEKVRARLAEEGGIQK